MILYKSKVIHVEDGILKVSSIRKNRNAYLGKKTTVGMTPVWLFYMASTWVTQPLIVIHIS